MRIIDADALMSKLKFIQEAEHQIYGKESWGFAGKCIAAVEDAPTIKERPTGKWIEFDSGEDKYDVIKCPCCKHTFKVDSYHWTDIGFIKDDFKFCPNCGVVMNGGV